MALTTRIGGDQIVTVEGAADNCNGSITSVATMLTACTNPENEKFQSFGPEISNQAV